MKIRVHVMSDADSLHDADEQHQHHSYDEREIPLCEKER
ncbi:hypothetical protein GGR46_000110 [Sphingomonas kyeonggiensis]|uniref:Uncharacterized protein n=1 Tax=Sphingomonas kyeonggiensis TaxID=1268553 RepID=A0A7W6NUQ0_9SPHN|nr:hypothetical protein [Sphingomonas kyeonggiensis]